MTGEGARAGEGEPFGFPRSARITGPDEIRALFRRGKRRKTRHLDVFLSSSPVARARLGLVVPKHKRNAVQRNQLKRRLRELGRTVLLPALREHDLALDVMLRTRPEAYAAGWEALRDEVTRLTEELCSSAR